MSISGSEGKPKEDPVTENTTKLIDSVTPLPLVPSLPEEADEKRLWIGNLDSRVTEYQLIKVLQKYGRVEKFDFLFHKSGPQQGQPRGYCFVTYDTREQAEQALKALDGQLALSKRLSAKWAHLKVAEDEEKNSSRKTIIPGLTAVAQQEGDVSVSTKIRAIEAKLKLMEENKEMDFVVPTLPSVSNQTLRGGGKLSTGHSVHPYQRHHNGGTLRRTRK